MSEQQIFHELLTALDEEPLPDVPLSAAELTGRRRTIHLDISEALPALLHPINRLIYSPHTIEPALLQPFLNGTREVILMCVQNGKTFPATLQTLHSSYLIADIQHAVSRRKRGETVLVVFPVTAQRHYVLQTTIHQIYAFRLELEYRDPRYDVRHTLPRTAPVLLQSVPMSLITAMGQQQGRIVRQITLTPRNTQGTALSVITDVFCAVETTEPVIAQYGDAPALACTLHDLSLGGVCLTVHAANTAETLVDRLVRLSIPLPRASASLPEWASVSLTLQLLGVMRNVHRTPSGKALHIRFIKRLPPEVDTLLWHLEGSTPP